MSSSLHWRPVPKPVDDSYLSGQLKHILGKNDPWVGGEERRVDSTVIPYLQGLADADVEDAQTLIDLIRKHGEVDLYLEH
jgi:hypothetical protein